MIQLNINLSKKGLQFMIEALEEKLASLRDINVQGNAEKAARLSNIVLYLKEELEKGE